MSCGDVLVCFLFFPFPLSGWPLSMGITCVVLVPLCISERGHSGVFIRTVDDLCARPILLAFSRLSEAARRRVFV